LVAHLKPPTAAYELRFLSRPQRSRRATVFRMYLEKSFSSCPQETRVVGQDPSNQESVLSAQSGTFSNYFEGDELLSRGRGSSSALVMQASIQLRPKCSNLLHVHLDRKSTRLYSSHL